MSSVLRSVKKRKKTRRLGAVNVDIKDAAYFRYGALSAASKEARDRAVAMLCEGMDAAAALINVLSMRCAAASTNESLTSCSAAGLESRISSLLITEMAATLSGVNETVLND